MRLGFWIHPWDVVDCGKEAFSKLKEIGINSLSMCVKYIEERQGWPGPSIIFQNCRRRTYVSEASRLYFEPSEGKYSVLPKELIPKRSSEVEGDALRKFVELCKEYGMKCVAWFPVLRNDDVARNYPKYASKDIYGSHPSYKRLFLCPNSAEVRRLVKLMLEDVVTKYDIDEVEFDFIRFDEPPSTYVDPLTKLMLSPCFCQRCREVLATKVSPNFVERVREELESFIGYFSKFPYDENVERNFAFYRLVLKVIKDAEFRRWLELRMETISSIIEELVDAVRSYGKGIGVSADVYPPSISWVFGQDFEVFSKVLDNVKVMLYFKPFGKSLASVPYEIYFAKSLTKGAEVYAGLPTWIPTEPSEIVEASKLAVEAGADGLYFYSFGWTPEKNLEAVKQVCKMFGGGASA